MERDSDKPADKNRKPEAQSEWVSEEELDACQPDRKVQNAADAISRLKSKKRESK